MPKTSLSIARVDDATQQQYIGTGPNSAPVNPPPPQRSGGNGSNTGGASGRVAGLFRRRNSLSLQQVMPTPFFIDDQTNSSSSSVSGSATSARRTPSPLTVTEDGSLVQSPRSEETSFSISSSAISLSTSSHSHASGSISSHNPSPQHASISKGPLRNLTSIFNSSAPSSPSNKQRTNSSDTVSPKPPKQVKPSKAPPIPPPKPSNLRVVHHANGSRQSFSTTGSGGSSGTRTPADTPSPSKAAFVTPLSRTTNDNVPSDPQSLPMPSDSAPSRDYIPSSDFHFPPKPPNTITSSVPKPAPNPPVKSNASRSTTTPVVLAPPSRSSVEPTSPISPVKKRLGTFDLRKRRSTSLSDIIPPFTAAQLKGADRLVSSPLAPSQSQQGQAGLLVAHAAGVKSSDSIASGRSQGSGQGSVSGAESSTDHASRVAMTGSLAPPQHPRQQQFSSLNTQLSAPPRHPGASASSSSGSLAPPQRNANLSASTGSLGAGSGDKFPRSAKAAKDTAKSAAVSGFMFGRKGLERILGGGHSHTQSASQGWGLGRRGEPTTGSTGPTHSRAQSTLNMFGMGGTADTRGPSSSSSEINIGAGIHQASDLAKIKIPGCIRRPHGRLYVDKLVMGRLVADAARDTAIDKELMEKRPWIDERTGQRRGEKCPALVVRCVQHLEVWAVKEEGIFRRSGKTSVVTKLAVDFDAGADYDLQSVNAADLDPHAVASLFKLFLRSIPGGIFTSELKPAIETVFSANPSGQLPSSTFSADEIDRVHRILWQLPDENRSVLYEMCRVLRKTDEHHKVNLMPLGNLLTVFPATLGAPSRFLKLVVEHQDHLFVSEPPPLPSRSSQVDSTSDSADDRDSVSGYDESISDRSEDIFDVTASRAHRTPPPVSASIAHQRSLSDMKLLQFENMRRRNESFGRIPPGSVTPILVPLPGPSLINSPTPSTSTSFASSTVPSSSASTTTSSSPSSPHSSSHNVATGWAGSKGKSSAKYATISNSNPQLPVNLSNAFDFTGNTVSSVPWKEQRESQDSVASEVTMDTLDEEENDSSGPRTRTQSTLRAIGSMMLGASSRSRGNTSTNDYGSTPTTPTRRTKMPASPAPSPGPGKLSRRSSSFFPPTPKFDKTEFVAAAGGGPTGTLPSRMRKGSVGNLKALISTPLELQRQMEEERNRPPHLSMIIPGGSLGDLLTSPTSSSSRVSSSSGNGAQPLSPRPRPSLPSSSHGSDSTTTPQLPSRDSGSTITLNKRWSVASGSSKRWSGTGSSKTASGRSSKRQSWSEQLLSLTGTTAIQLVHASTSTSGMASGSDNRGASKTSLAASGSSSDGSSGGLPARSKTPIADLFRGGSTSLDVDRATAARSKPDLKASSSVASFSAKVNAQEEPESVRRRRSGTLPAFSTFAPLSLSMFDEPGARSGSVTRSAAPPSSYTTSSSTNYPMQRAIDALAMLQQQQPTSPATVGITSVPKSHGLTLQVPGATDESDGRAPRPSLSGGSPVVRKKHWSRTGDASGSLSVNTATGRPSSSGGRSAESSTKAAATSASNSPLLSIGASAPSTSGEDDWTSSVLAAAHISPTISVNNSGSLSSPLSAASAATVTPFSSVPIASSKSMPTSPAKATPTSTVPSPVSVASTATVTALSPKSTPSSSSATVNSTSVPTSPTQRAPARKLSEAILNASAIPDGTVRDARRMFESQSQSQAGGRSPTSPKKTRAPIPDAFTSSTR